MENLVLAIKAETKTEVFEDRVLGRISGPRRNELTGGRRKLHNDVLHKLYSSAV
jgi:hypothetical protein